MSDKQDVATPTPPHPGYAWVKSGLTGENRDKVVISEYDPVHPANAEGKHEIWVAGADSAPQRVAKTPEVVRHLREGELIEVGQPKVDATPVEPIPAPLTNDERSELEALRAKQADASATTTTTTTAAPEATTTSTTTRAPRN